MILCLTVSVAREYVQDILKIVTESNH